MFKNDNHYLRRVRELHTINGVPEDKVRTPQAPGTDALVPESILATDMIFEMEMDLTDEQKRKQSIVNHPTYRA